MIMNKPRTLKKHLLTACFLLGTVILMAQTPTVSNLTATGTDLKWYLTLTGGTALDFATPLVNGQHYWGSQTLNGCESTARVEVVANVNTQSAPTAGSNSPAQTQVTWNWNAASGASGYKWNTVNTYATATNTLTATTLTETGLGCNTSYSRYVWAYNASGCVSGVTALAQTTSACGSGDAIYDALSASRASYSAASANDLVKITAAEYANVKTALGTTVIGYTGALNDWATSCTAPNTTFSYNNNSNDYTIPNFSALNYPVAFSFHPSLNPQGSYGCQLKYNNGGTLANVSNYFSGATANVIDRQYFVIKTPSQLPNAAPYIAVYSSAGVATVYGTSPNTYWAWVEGNPTGAQTFTNASGAVTQLPAPQVLQTAVKQWP